MNLQHKIEAFSKAVTWEAEEKRRKTMDSISEKLRDAYFQDEALEKKKAELVFKSEVNKAEQLKNKEYIAAVSVGKRQLIELRNALILELFSNTTNKLSTFMASEEYKAYILEQMSPHVQNNGKVNVVLSEKDMKFAEDIKKISDLVVDVIPAKEDMVGGFKVIIIDKNRLIDASFKTKLDEEYKNFNSLRIAL